MEEEEDDKNFCYIEGTQADKSAVEEINELHENVWFKMKPPKPCKNPYTPFVTARQIDLVRALLGGPKHVKVEPKVDFIHVTDECDDIPTRRPPSREKLSLNKQKSSVRFLSATIYD